MSSTADLGINMTSHQRELQSKQTTRAARKSHTLSKAAGRLSTASVGLSNAATELFDRAPVTRLSSAKTAGCHQLMKTRTARMKLGLGTLAFGLCVVLQAAPLEVTVLDANYTASVGWLCATNYVTASSGSSSIVSAAPASNRYINQNSGLPMYNVKWAEADASLFEIFGYTSTAGGVEGYGESMASSATARTDIFFSPLSSQTTSIGLDFLGANEWYYSDGYASLVDVTANQTLWNYGWAFMGQGTVPWTNNYDGVAGQSHAALSVDTDFDATHTYELVMNTDTDSNGDTQNVQIQLFGIEVVPEPSAFALIGLGTAAWLISYRRRTLIARSLR
jgi:hypothetical protein